MGACCAIGESSLGATEEGEGGARVGPAQIVARTFPRRIDVKVDPFEVRVDEA